MRRAGAARSPRGSRWNRRRRTSRTRPSPRPWRTELDLEVGAAVEEMERALDELPRVTAFLAQGATTTPTAPLPIREPVAEQRLWTPACTLANVEAIRFALKVALAAAICGVVLDGNAPPGGSRRRSSRA